MNLQDIVLHSSYLEMEFKEKHGTDDKDMFNKENKKNIYKNARRTLLTSIISRLIIVGRTLCESHRVIGTYTLRPSSSAQTWLYTAMFC